jgi:hypothetical protein
VLTKWRRFRSSRSTFHTTQRVVLSQRPQAGGESGPVIGAARDAVLIQLLSGNASGEQSNTLQVESLGPIGLDTRM